MDISQIINELGEDRELYFNAVSPPIYQTSNFAYKTVDALANAFENEFDVFLYSRGNNPTVDILRKKLAALDGAEDCLVFNNGAAATTAAVLSHMKAGDHAVCVRNPYTWVSKLFDNILKRYGVEVSYIDGREIANWEEAIRPNTTFFYLESPNSWDFALQPIAEVAALAKKHQITTLIDNSYCTPLYQRPIEMGIDMAMQTATKYIGGHSDTLGGVLSGSGAAIRKIFDSELMTLGSGIQPFNAWMLIRGLRTLPARLERIHHTTEKVIQFLLQRPEVERIIFPLHPSFPQYELAKQQMRGGAGLMTMVLATRERENIVRFCESLQHIMMAVSWGGHESLVIPKCAGIPKAEFNGDDQEHRYVRLYCGLEEPDYLINDLQQAFDKMKE
ncbi:MAG: PLP-dependent transferase [Chitinophagales bacterium]|nr:PLP-dependent transferase [Chitinophagales bacterium]MCB9031445.1 PLP-dependent transferase [Chitinophagales bacterium]